MSNHYKLLILLLSDTNFSEIFLSFPLVADNRVACVRISKTLVFGVEIM